MPRILTNSTTIFLVLNILIKNRTHFIHMKSLIAARMLSANHLLCIKINVELFCVCVWYSHWIDSTPALSFTPAFHTEPIK